MNRWIALVLVAVGVTAFAAALLGLFAWRARSYDRRVGLGPDDGGHYTGGSDLDHLALDQTRDDAQH